jgi:hypothetical protein
VAFEMSVFALAALALVLAGAPVPGGLLVVVAAIDAWALHRLGAGLRKRLARFLASARDVTGTDDERWEGTRLWSWYALDSVP